MLTPEEKIKERFRKISPETRKAIKKLTLMNNAFMNLVLENNTDCAEEILRVILNKNDLVVKKVQTQRMFQGFDRSIYLDILAEDSKGVLYNIEIQRADEGANPRRARFHTGMIDVHSLKAGQDFNKLPEVYVIFITLNDVLKLNRAIYTIHKYIDGELTPFEDGSHLIYINCSAEDDGSEICKLIHDLRCKEAGEMYFPRLAARVKFLKEAEGGVINVEDYFGELQKKAIEKAVAKVEKKLQEAENKAQKDKENLVFTLINIGKLTLEEIAKCSGLSLEKVQMLANTL